MNRSIRVFLALITCFTLGCGGAAKQKIASSDNIKTLGLAITYYWQENKKPPASLDELKPLFGQDLDLYGMGEKEKLGGGKSFDEVIKNPLTGANPGYDYVAPAADLQARSNFAMLYQLRDGKRDESLAVGYADGSVRTPQ